MTSHSTRRPLFVWGLVPYFVVLLLGTALVYWKGIDGGWVWDDEGNFQTSPGLSMTFARHVAWAWKSRTVAVYQPLSWHLFWVEARLFGLVPQTFHCVSIVLHALISVLVFLLPLRWLSLTAPDCDLRQARTVSLIASLFFAWHPLRVEVVAWASSQPYLASVLLGLVSLFAFLESLHETGRRSRRLHSVSLVLFIAALLFKSILFSLPVLLLGMRLFWDEKNEPETSLFQRVVSALRKDAAFWLGSVIILFLSIWARSLGGSDTSLAAPTLVSRICQPFLVVFYALWKTAMPWSLSALYPVTNPVPALLGSLAVCLLFAAAVFSFTRGFRLGLLALLCFIVVLVPGIGSSLTERVAFADRFSYVPAILLSFFLTIFLAPKWKYLASRRFAITGGFAITGIAAVFTGYQISFWRNDSILWAHAILTTASTVGKAYANLSDAFGRENRLDEVVFAARKAIALDPEIPEAHNNLGMAFWLQGDKAGALRELDRALAIRETYPLAQYNRGVVLQDLGRLPEALASENRAIALNPYYGDALETRAQILRQLSTRSNPDQGNTQRTQLPPELAVPNP